MNSSQLQQPNLAQQAIAALDLLDPEDQLKVLDYIQSIISSQNEQEPE